MFMQYSDDEQIQYIFDNLYKGNITCKEWQKEKVNYGESVITKLN